MDIIYATNEGVDIGVIQNCTLDYEASTDKNYCTFEIQTALDINPLSKGHYIYVEQEEYGGRIDAIKLDTAIKTVYASGRSWRGILGSKVIEPPPGEDYRIATGNVGDVMAGLFEDLELDDLFVAEETDISVTSYKFNRYTDLYSGLMKMLAKVGYKLNLFYKSGKVHVGAVPVVDYSEATEITSDLFDFTIQSITPINHIIGLGKGELSEREIIHRYVDADGNVSTEQYYFGMDEVAMTYENTQYEVVDELIESVEEELKSKITSDSLDIKANNLVADVGDVITAHEIYTGIKIKQYVTNKIFNISNQAVKIQYKVGNKL